MRISDWFRRVLFRSKRFCSVRGGKAGEYVDISRLADEAMGKIDQIPLPLNWGDAEMASILGSRGLAGSDATRCTAQPQYLRHFDAANAQLMGDRKSTRLNSSH